YLYYGLRDYPGALAELEIARRTLPNDPRLFELTGYILQRRGQQEQGLRNLERAAELDPHNFNILQQIALSYQELRRYAESLVALGDNPCLFERAITLSHSFGEGLLARMTKDEARARTAFETARAEQEKIVQAQPDFGPTLCVLGLIDAALGRTDLALDEGR